MAVGDGLKVLVLSKNHVSELMTITECIDVMADALKDLAVGRVVLPLRQVVMIPQRSGLLGLMPAMNDTTAMMGAKIISVFPENRQHGLESHQGVVLLFEANRGRLLAICDASSITAIRTAAVSGLATRLLSRTDAGDLAILGSGAQAGAHLEAMLAVRKITRVRVWSRNNEYAKRFARMESERHRIHIDALNHSYETVAGADLICAVTASTTPILQRDWITAGAHINAVGACIPTARELDSRTVAAARLFVDRRESILRESGDFLIPKSEGAINDDHILGEIGDLLLNRMPGRISHEDITVFKSLGIAIEDLASATFLYNKAISAGKGSWIDMGEEPDAAN